MMREQRRRARRSVPLALVLGASCADLPVELDTVPPGPEAPQVSAPVSPTANDVGVLRGLRQPNTALLLDGVVVRDREADGAFRLEVPLAPGFNTFTLAAQDAAGRVSDEANATIFFDGEAPGPVIVSAPARTARNVFPLLAQKPVQCRLHLNGEAVPGDPGATTATLQLPLGFGDNRFRLGCTDDAGNEGTITTFAIARVALADIPFAFDVPATVATSPLALRATCDADVEARLVDGAPSPCVDGVFTRSVDLTNGANAIRVEVAFVGEINTAASLRETSVVFAPSSEGDGQ